MVKSPTHRHRVCRTTRQNIVLRHHPLRPRRCRHLRLPEDRHQRPWRPSIPRMWMCALVASFMMDSIRIFPLDVTLPYGPLESTGGTESIGINTESIVMEPPAPVSPHRSDDRQRTQRAPQFALHDCTGWCLFAPHHFHGSPLCELLVDHWPTIESPSHQLSHLWQLPSPTHRQCGTTSRRRRFLVSERGDWGNSSVN